MSESNPLDTHLIGEFLGTVIDGFSPPISIKKFDGGQSNPTYLLETQEKKFVLRAKPLGELLKSAHQVDREFRVMRALSGSKVPVPRMLYLSEEDSIIGRMFFVMEYLEGRIFWDPALLELNDDSKQRGEIYDAMNEALAALHSIDPATIGLSDFGVPGNYFERQLSRWTKQYVASELDRCDDIHRLIKWLENHMPPDDGVLSLVHGDYRLDNMVFDTEKPKILGILDWELSTVGHPLADLAYQCMQLRLPHEGEFRGLAGVDRDALGIPDEQTYVKNYCARRNIGEIGHWFFYLAFSFFRIAAILQGVYRRSVDGNASNPEKAKAYGKAVPILGRMAMQMIHEESN